MTTTLPIGIHGTPTEYEAPADRAEQLRALHQIAGSEDVIGLILPSDQDFLASMRGKWTVPCWTTSRTVRVYSISLAGSVCLMAESRQVAIPDHEAMGN